MHLKSFTKSVQLPSSRHGCSSQSSILTSQNWPDQPGGHSQRNRPCNNDTHLPLFWQTFSLDEQGSEVMLHPGPSYPERHKHWIEPRPSRRETSQISNHISIYLNHYLLAIETKMVRPISFSIKTGCSFIRLITNKQATYRVDRDTWPVQDKLLQYIRSFRFDTGVQCSRLDTCKRSLVAGRHKSRRCSKDRWHTRRYLFHNLCQ